MLKKVVQLIGCGHVLIHTDNEISQIFPGTGGAIESKRLDVPLLGQGRQMQARRAP